MPKISTHRLVTGHLGFVPTKVEQPAQADPDKLVEVDGAMLVWTDGLETYQVLMPMELLDELFTDQIPRIYQAHDLERPEIPELSALEPDESA